MRYFILLSFLFVRLSTIGQNTFPSSGNVGIGTTSPAYALDVYAPANTWKGRFGGPDGYITIGPANSSWAHIYTDRAAFIFNQSVWSIPGSYSSYSTADLTLQTGGTTRMTLSNSTGNVGIGTNSPTAKLHVVGPSTGHGVAVYADGGGDVMLNPGGSLFFDGNYSYASGNYIRPVSSNTQTFVTSGVERMRITSSGNIGIGTTSPDAMLSVSGQVHAQEVKVSIAVPGPDYVFDKDYELTSLDSIKSYIDQNKHLPEIPSATEMEKNGVQLGEMNMLLLKKIEELTLYMIEQNKRIDYQQKEIKELKTLINK